MKWLSLKHDPLEQTARCWVGQSKQGMYLGNRTNRRLRSSLDWGHEGCIHEVLQEEGRSSMYKIITVSRKIEIAMSLCNMFSVRIMIIPCPWIGLQCWLMFIFCRLKINHVSHEFILEFTAVAANYLFQTDTSVH
jgi:hypothetical protein